MAVRLLLFLIAVGVVYCTGKFCYKMFRSGKIDDEAAERKQLKQDADKVAAIEKELPAADAKANDDAIERFSNRT